MVSNIKFLRFFGDFYVKQVYATGKMTTCPSTHKEAWILWSSVVKDWLTRFVNAPPQELVEAYLMRTGNGHLKECTIKRFQNHADWKEEYKTQLGISQEYASRCPRLDCQYEAWRVAKSYANSMGKTDAEAADAGRQSIDAASTAEEYTLFKEDRSQWEQNIRRRLDALYAPGTNGGEAGGGPSGGGGDGDAREGGGSGGGDKAAEEMAIGDPYTSPPHEVYVFQP